MADYGYMGKILRVDLTTGEATETSSDQYLPKFMGGRGFGAKLYWDEIAPDVAVFDPENKLIFTTGLIQGTGATGHGRSILTAKAPQSYPLNAYQYNHAGGDWGPELKYAGYDALIVEGKASEPVYLWINDGHVEIRDAKHLWGLNTYETRNAIRSRHGKKPKIALIGPAGENLVTFAVILAENGAAFGMGGFGAVMGSKKLKAIVLRGTGKVNVAKPKELIQAFHHKNRLINIKVGETVTGAGGVPVTQGGKYAAQYHLMRADPSKLVDEMKEGTANVRFGGCAGCPKMCFTRIEFTDNALPSGACQCVEFAVYNAAEQRYYGGKNYGRVAWEASMLNELLGVNATYTMTETGTGLTPSRANYGGLDILCEYAKRGIFTEENTGLPWDKVGSAEFYRKFMRMIAYREGFGDIIAQGFGAMAEYVANHEEFGPNRADAVEIYQIGFPRAGQFGATWRHWLYMSNGVPAPVRAIVWAAACRDGSNPHVRLDTAPSEWAIEWLGTDQVLDNTTWDTSKVQGAIFHEHIAVEADSLITCDMLMAYKSPYTVDGLVDISPNAGDDFWNAITGETITQEELWKVSERIVNLERAIMVREGRTRADDTFFEPVFAEVDSEGNPMIPKTEFTALMDEYYQTRGWDVATGMPKRAKLEELDLKDVADALEALGKLPT